MKNLDIQVGDKVTYIDKQGKKCIIIVSEDKGELSDCEDSFISDIIKIERPKYEIIKEKKEILDEVEKEYLWNIIKPFKDKVECIRKVGLEGIYNSNNGKEYIMIGIVKDTPISLPYFKENTMYKGMKINRFYTLKDLGLEEEE